MVEGRSRGVERDAQLVQPGLAQRIAAPLVQQNRIGVEEHMRPTLLEVRDKARQIWIEQRLADPMQYRTLDSWQLIDDLAELQPGQMMLGLKRQEMVVGQRAGGAQRVAAVSDLHIDLARQFG